MNTPNAMEWWNGMLPEERSEVLTAGSDERLGEIGLDGWLRSPKEATDGQSRKFAAGQVFKYTWGGLPLTVKILKRTAKTVRIHVTHQLLAPEGEECSRRLLANENGESFWPLGNYICGAQQIWLLPDDCESCDAWDNRMTVETINAEGSK